MLKLTCKGAAALAAALFLSVGAAQAAQPKKHTVIIVDGTYFPSIVIAKAGDWIIFDNESGSNHVVSGPEESWTSGNLGASSSFRLDLDEDTPNTFSGTGGGYEEAFGEIIFTDD